MEKSTQINRQARGCGFEPAAPSGIRVLPWQPPLSKLGYRHRPLPVICAGYTTRLPEVQEAVRAHGWAARGQLDVFLGGERANENLLAYVDILDAELAAVKSWAMTSTEEGGGRDAKG